MSNPWIVIAVTVALIALSAFFVAVEFALISAKRHRLEDAAPNSRSARAALRSASELTVLLAGSQLGITVCTSRSVQSPNPLSITGSPLPSRVGACRSGSRTSPVSFSH